MNKYLLSSAALVMALGFSSCVGDLDVTPIDPNSIMTVDEAALYTKCYANMALPGNTGGNGDCDIDGLDGGTAGFLRQLFNANELTTDESICAWGDPGIPAFNYNQWDADHPMLAGLYYRLYVGIDYCNHYLEVCSGVDATREAEVRFLRTLYYYYLMDCFGNVPFALKISAESPQQIQRADLFEWLETEIKDVLPSMHAPIARKSSDAGYGTADQDAANMLLARMYLNAEVYTGKARWAEAQEYAEKIINGPHKLWTSGVTDNKGNYWSAYQMLFMGDNGESGASIEGILPLLQDGKTTTSWGTSLFLMASTWKADMDTDATYGTTEFWAGNRCRSTFVKKFFPEGNAPAADYRGMAAAAGDDRALLHGIDRELYVSTPTDYASGFACAKFRNTYSTGAAPHHSQFVDMDFFLMRTGEAYLIAAEAAKRQNKPAASYINELRKRANTATLVTEADCTLDYILDERARELFYEGFRRTDLIRYGYFGGTNSSKYAWEWKGGNESGIGFSEDLNVFALPSEDVNANKNLTQNKGYN